MTLQEEYCELVLNHLNRLNNKFETQLSEFVNQAFSDDVKHLNIEYYSPCFSDEFSVYFYALDKSANRVGDIHKFLEHCAVVVPAEIFEDEKYEDIDPWSTASEILESWLRERWKNAGSQQYPAFVAHHDSHFLRNLADGSRTNWDELANAMAKL